MNRQPETKTAVLFSVALRRPTLHHYVCTQQVADRDGRGFEHLFECAESGSQRRWGLEEFRLKTKEEQV